MGRHGVVFIPADETLTCIPPTLQAPEDAVARLGKASMFRIDAIVTATYAVTERLARLREDRSFMATVCTKRDQ